MNVTVENLAPCRKLMRIEIDAQAVDSAFEAMTKDFQKQVALPGFRAGKAPREMVVKKYSEDIQSEVKKKLIPDAYRKAITEQKLLVVGYPDIEEIQFGRGQALQFAATVETAPDFELPEYKGLPVKKTIAGVTDADVEKAINMLRERQVKYNTMDRALADGDVAVVNYEGQCDGKPITDTAPTARGLTTQKSFWITIEKDSFIPGFSEQLHGLKAGDKKTVNVDFPKDFVSAPLADKKGVYEVEVVEVKEKILPAVDDAFAKSYGAESLAKLEEGVRQDLTRELEFKQARDLRSQVVSGLLSKVEFDLPETAVLKETRNVVYSIVNENQKRGVSKEVIDQSKDEIFGNANNTARERVKASFLFNRIAEKESIQVEQMEVAQRIGTLAQNYNMTPDRFVKELEKRNGIAEIFDTLLSEKVVEFLVKNAAVEEVAAPAV